MCRIRVCHIRLRFVSVLFVICVVCVCSYYSYVFYSWLFLVCVYIPSYARVSYWSSHLYYSAVVRIIICLCRVMLIDRNMSSISIVSLMCVFVVCVLELCGALCELCY